MCAEMCSCLAKEEEILIILHNHGYYFLRLRVPCLTNWIQHFVVLCQFFMPAFDPVRDAVLNSPVESRVASSHSLAVILNDDGDHPSLNAISSSSAIPYNPKVRITPPGSVLTPLSQAEIVKYKSFRGQGVSRLTKRKRSASEETDDRPVKRHAGDVGVVVEHCKWPLLFLVYSFSSCLSRQLTARCGNCPTT